MKYKKTKPLLLPEYMFDSFLDVTPSFLESIGVRALVIDIDNTLAPYEQNEPDEKTVAWFDSLKARGIKAALISNNHKERVELFNRSLGLYAYPDSKKPSGKSIIDAMKKMGSTPNDTAALGDQLLTDTLAAHRLGLVSIIVPPIKDRTDTFFRFKRELERPYIRKYRKLHGVSVNKNSLSWRTWK